MSVSSPLLRALPNGRMTWSALAWSRLSDYGQLIKPRISLMVLLTVSVGYFLAGDTAATAGPLWLAWLGIGLTAACSSALNQWWEQDSDARMRRTMDRPIPSGRMSPAEVLAFGCLCGIAGMVILTVCVNGLTAVLTAATSLLYVLVYTPLKSRTLLCTTIGAIPGALPPVLGWVAAGRDLDAGAGALFAILFLWQFPHFLAIAWLYQHDYADAGLKMLPTGQQANRVIGLSAVAYALCLLAMSLVPTAVGLAGPVYGFSAVVLTSVYVAAAVRFAWRPERSTARGLLAVSLLHLPLLLLILTWDHWRGLQAF
jgi:protoheme IX farnesyltransferase